MSLTAEELRQNREARKAKRVRHSGNHHHIEMTPKKVRRLSIFELFKLAR